MNSNYIGLLVLLSINIINATNYNYVITNEAPKHTRIGDIFTDIIKALWFAHKNNVPYVHHSCAYTDQMNITQYATYDPENYLQTKTIRYDDDFDANVCTAYKVSYKYGIDRWGDIIHNDEWQHFKAMRDEITCDSVFMKQLRLLLRPKQMPSKKIPSGMITVAIHMRTAEQFPGDSANLAKSLTLRFMPDSYYIWALKKLCSIYPDQYLYVHIFTDDADPAARVAYLQEQLIEYPLIFSYRAHDNRHDANVLEDLWSMTYYDCLIRPWSQYSFYAELLGNHKLIIFAETWIDGNERVRIGVRYENDLVEYKEVVL